MTRKMAALAFDLAVAGISISLFVATVVLLATHQIGSFHGIFILIGTALAGTIAVLKFQHDKEPWPIRVLTPTEAPAWKIERPLVTNFGWTRRMQDA